MTRHTRYSRIPDPHTNDAAWNPPRDRREHLAADYVYRHTDDGLTVSELYNDDATISVDESAMQPEVP